MSLNWLWSGHFCVLDDSRIYRPSAAASGSQALSSGREAPECFHPPQPPLTSRTRVLLFSSHIPSMSSSSSSATSTTTPTPAKGTNNRRIIKTAISDDNDEEGTDLIPQTPSKKKRASPKHSPTKADAWTPEMRLKLFEAYQDASQVKWDDVAKKVSLRFLCHHACSALIRP